MQKHIHIAKEQSLCTWGGWTIADLLLPPQEPGGDGAFCDAAFRWELSVLLSWLMFKLVEFIVNCRGLNSGQRKAATTCSSDSCKGV